MKKQAIVAFSFTGFYHRLLGNSKAVLLYMLLMVFLFLGLAAPILINKEFSFNVSVFILLLFAGLGIFHFQLIKQRFYFLAFYLYKDPLFFTLFIAFAGTVAQLFVYLFFTSVPVLFLIACCCSFLLPCLVFLAWQSFTGIPEKVYKTWSLSEIYGYHEVPATLQNKMMVKIKMARKEFSKEEIFSMNVSRQVTLGNFFFSFINSFKDEQDLSVAYLDDQNNPHKWIFYVERFWGLKKVFLNPARNFRRNNIKEHDIIIARRVLS